MLEISEIIESVDIVDYISQYIDLEQQGKDLFGLSPFKSENTPSFSVSQDKQVFYDFSSGIGGNVITFIEKYNKCDFKEALSILKQYANIDENYVDNRLNITKVIKKFKQRKTKQTFENHQILDKDIMSRYEKDLHKLQIWNDDGIKFEIMEKYQVRYDPLSDRIVFPIRDSNGSIINVKGRTLDPDYKEKKIRKYTYFNKLGELDFIFGYYEHLQQIQEKKELILFEGEKSVMIAEGWDIMNTGSLLTSHLDPLQLKVLIKLGVKIVFALDKGLNIRLDENIKKLARFVQIQYIEDNPKNGLLEDKMSPVDRGFEVWNTLYERRKNYN